jgi:hypothetical protein
LIFTPEFVEELKAKIVLILKQVIPSRTLRQAVTASYRKTPHGHQMSVNIPHYWAIYYHDGSGPITMPKGKYMVWYRDPKDDPRYRGGYPVTRSQVRPLTLSKKNFNKLVREGKLVVRKSVGRRRAHPFAKAAAAAWGIWIHARLQQRTAEEINKALAPLRKILEI